MLFCQGLKLDVKQFLVMGYIVIVDKLYYWLLGGYYCMYWYFWFFLLGIDYCWIGGCSVMDWVVVEDYVVDVMFVQFVVELLFCFFFGEKFGMMNFDVVGEIFWQFVEKMLQCGEIVRIECCWQLQLVLVDV